MSNVYNIPFDTDISVEYGVNRAKAKHTRLTKVEVRFAYPDNASLLDLMELFKTLNHSYPGFDLTCFTKEDYDDEDFVCYLQKLDEIDMTPEDVALYDMHQKQTKSVMEKNLKLWLKLDSDSSIEGR